MTGLPQGAVLVVGTGLIGTSIGLALRANDIRVYLDDADPAVLEVAVSRGAGTNAEPFDVGLVVAAVPPRSLGRTLAAALERWPRAVVTDVGSVKVLPLAELLAAGVDVRRYAGGHPMGGSERSGAEAASAGLFTGRAWAVTPHEQTSAAATEAVRALASRCGAVVVELSPLDHDAAVARVSHLPHLMAVLTAAQLPLAPSAQLELSGQGLRDVTRIAAADPALWTQILAANAVPLRELLTRVRDNLDDVLTALEAVDVPALEELLSRGRRGAALIPAKTGSPAAKQPG